MKKRMFGLLVVLFSLLGTQGVSAQRIAVLDFNAGAGISQADVDGISAIFNTYFNPKGYTLVERTQIDKVIDEQSFQRGRMTEAQMVRIGQILNISKIVVGDVNIVMGQYNVDVRVLNVESGTIAAKDGATWAKGSSFRTMMNQLATRLASQIAITQVVAVEPAQPAKPVLKNGDVINPDGMEMVYVEGTGGSGIMGQKSFYIGKYEVTQAQWKAVMGNNPSYFGGENNPVEQVSWDDCQVFIKKLNELSGRTYRLPTFAEREYAARGGKARETYEYAGSNDADKVAWYGAYDGGGRRYYSHGGNCDSRTHMVGTKNPNSLGIYDMSGNVWEWCQDDVGDGDRSIAGGSWSNSMERENRDPWYFGGEESVSITKRWIWASSRCSNKIGFRLVLEP